MSDSKRSAGNGIGIGTVLAMIFMTLKLTGHIDWSWLWVLAPIWIPMAFVAVILLAVLTVGGIVWIYERKRK